MVQATKMRTWLTRGGCLSSSATIDVHQYLDLHMIHDIQHETCLRQNKWSSQLTGLIIAGINLNFP
jgi:hypothetical protein